MAGCLFLMAGNAAAVDYLVQGAGTTAVNGVYIEGAASESDDGSGRLVHVYELTDAGDNVLYTLFYGGCHRKWLIVPPDVNRHNHYYATGGSIATPDYYLLPDDSPHGWIAHNLGTNPPPTVSPITRAFNHQLLLTATGAADIERTAFTAHWYVEAPAGLDLVFRLDLASDAQFVNLVEGYGDLDVSSRTQRGARSSLEIPGLSANTTYYYRVRAYPGGSPASAAGSNTVRVGTIPDAYHVSGAGTASINGLYRYSMEQYNNRPVFKNYADACMLLYLDYHNWGEPIWRFVDGTDVGSLNDETDSLYEDAASRSRGLLLPPTTSWRRTSTAVSDPPPTAVALQPLAATAATDIRTTQFSANWNSFQGAFGYDLDVALDSGFSNMLSGYHARDVGNATTCVVNGISPNTRHYYRVRAYYPDSGPDSSNSNIIAATTLANQPQVLPFSDVGVNSIQVNWSGNGNPPGTQYFCENTTSGDDSGWTTDTHWNNTAIRCGRSSSRTA